MVQSVSNSMSASDLINKAISADTFITDDAWQYAVVKQPVATNLMYQQCYRGILCKNVPQGNRVNANLYAQGQAGNAGFATRVANLQNPNYSPGNGKFGCTIV
jgi:predicted NAD/FAD-dependent oxidoreductase